MRLRTAILAGALLLAPGAAMAGTAKELACIRVDPAVAQSVADKTIAAMNSGQQPNLDDEIQAIVPVAAACRAKFSWSDAELESGVTYAIAVASRGGATAGLKQNGIDPVKATKAFNSLPANIRAQFQQDPVPDDAVNAFIAAAATQKITLANQRQGQYLGMLAALLAVAESNQAKFLATE